MTGNVSRCPICCGVYSSESLCRGTFKDRNCNVFQNDTASLIHVADDIYNKSIPVFGIKEAMNKSLNRLDKLKQ